MNRNRLKVLKIIALVAFLIISIEVVAIIYIKSIPVKETKAYYDYVRSVDSMENGYVAVGSNNNNSLAYEKGKITVFNKDKEKVLERVFNKGYHSTYLDVVAMKDGYVTVGSYESTKSELKSGKQTALIVKYDLKGNVVFDNDFKILGDSKFTSIVSKDGFYVCGQSISDKKDSTGAVLVKYDKEGQEEWVKYYGTKDSIFYDLVIANDSVYTVGYKENGIGVIVKYNLNGDYVTSYEYEGSSELGFTHIESYQEKLYVSGSNKESRALLATFDYDCHFLQDSFCSKNGNIHYQSFTIDSDGNVIVIGTVSSMIDEEEHSDGVIGKYNSNLKELSVVRYATDRNIYFHDISIYDNKYLVVGDSIKESKDVDAKIMFFSPALKILEV
ncbi:MAG: hypothetical protein IJ193_01375 [Bacilli bacterium]|nr:hypothetical protein [Bacilli bacterium]